jgi:tetratricopeptide (TPR) repeat protein
MAILPLQTDPRPIPRDADARPARWRSVEAVLLAMATIILASGTSGCATLSKRRVDDNVVAARQLAIRGMEAMQQQRFPEAETLFGESLQMCPLDERTRRHYAQMLWRRGAQEQAIGHMEEAVRLSGGSPEMLVELGDMYLARGELRLAEAQAEQALQASRQLAAAWVLKGDVLHRRGQLTEGLACYHRALAYREHYPRAQLAIAKIYREQANAGRCLATLRSLASGFPPDQIPADVLLQQALALKDLNRHGEALEYFAAARQAGGTSPELLYRQAETLLLAGDPQSARLTVHAGLDLATSQHSAPPVREQLELLERRLASAAPGPSRDASAMR